MQRAPSIKVTEEQRPWRTPSGYINITFMNELSIIFHKMGIDMKEVLEAAGAKCNFWLFFPVWSEDTASV